MLFFRKNSLTKKERRRKDRVLFRHKVMLLVPSLACSEGYVEVSCRNISEGGILVEAKRCYPQMVPCRVKIVLSDNHENIFHGVIMWTEEDEPNDKWDVGISFINLGLQGRKVLKKIIEQSA